MAGETSESNPPVEDVVRRACTEQFKKGFPDNAIETFMEWLSGGVLKSLQGVQLPKDLTKWQDWVKFVASLAGVNPPGLGTLLQANESDEEMPTLDEVLQLEYNGITVNEVLNYPIKLLDIGRGYLEETSDTENLEKIVGDFLQGALMSTLRITSLACDVPGLVGETYNPTYLPRT